jgi:phosphoglycolate phosphatase-like HAD superfamily hydrolase
MKKDAVVVFDADGVLLDLIGGAVRFFNIPSDTIKTTIQAAKEIIAGKTRNPEVEKMLSAFVTDGGFKNLKPLPGAVSGIRKLHDAGYPLFIVTAAPDQFAKDRTENLMHVFGDVFREIHCVRVGGKGPALSKFKKYKTVFFIDDSPQNIRDSIGIITHPILFGNTDAALKKKGVPSFQKFDDVVSYVMSFDDRCLF